MVKHSALFYIHNKVYSQALYFSEIQIKVYPKAPCFKIGAF